MIRGHDRSADGRRGRRAAEDQPSADPKDDSGRPDPGSQEWPGMACGPGLFTGVSGSA